MNRIAAIVLFAGAIFMTANRATGQSSVIRVNVPFSFTINDTSVPAGSYTLGFDLMYPDMLIVRDQANNVIAKHLGQRGLVRPGKNGALIFHRYGGRYFLSEVRFDSASNGIFLPATKLEKQARKMGGKADWAFIAAQ